jgi:hypothetical protein
VSSGLVHPSSIGNRNYPNHLLKNLSTDASKPSTSPNLEKLAQSATLEAPEDQNGSSTPSPPTVLHQITLRTLSHLVALALHPSESFPPPNTRLIVIDSLNMIIDQDYPRLPFLTGTRTDAQKWKASRRYAVLGSLVTGLTKLAALHGLAVIVTTGYTTRTRSDSGMSAALAPGIGCPEWEAGVWNRLAMFRDFAGRFVGVQKVQGKNFQPMDPVGHIGIVVQFEIDDDGQLRHPSGDLQRPDDPLANRPVIGPSSSPPKNGVKRAYDEVADSDDDEIDEYGWAEADDEVAVMADVIVLGERPVQDVLPTDDARPTNEVLPTKEGEATGDEHTPDPPPAEGSPSPTV